MVGLVDEDGKLVNRYSYDEWGNLMASKEAIENPIKYSGEYFDEETGLYYLRARYYDPAIGRFISEDSYEGSVTNPLSLNLYTYTYNNPLIYHDPSGHNPILMKLVEIAETSLPQIVNEGQMFIYQYGPQISNAIDIGGRIVSEFGSEIYYGIKDIKDKVVNAINNESGQLGRKTVEETTRVRHYTNRKGLQGIKNDGVIIAQDNNRVYVEPANKKPLSAKDAEDKYGLKRGKGRDYVEFNVPSSLLEWKKNPAYGTLELTIKGDVYIINPKFFKRK